METAYAATSYVPLEGGLISSLGVPAPTFTAGQETSLFASTSFLYTLAFVIIIVTASFRYALAGMLRIQASEEGIRKSKEEFKRVTYGLLGVLGLWLVLFTVNKDMLTGDVTLTNLKLATTTSPGRVSVSTSPSNASSPIKTPTTNDDPAGWKSLEQDAIFRDVLKNMPNGGIGVNKPVCKLPTSTSCTTVGGLPQETMSMLLQLRNTCSSGKIILSGGTEAGHSSHGPGKRPIDISINYSDPQIESCIRSFEVSSAKPKNRLGGDLCFKVYTKFGYTFCDEMGGDRHWHVY